MDLSNPASGSVNDSIDPQGCSLSYVSVDDVTKFTASMGKGTLLAKMDLQSAYRMVSVHPEDKQLLDM